MQRRRKLINSFSNAWMITSLVIILLIPFIIGTGLFIKSLPVLEIQPLDELIFSSAWAPTKGHFGFWSFILGSLYVTVFAFIISAPICFFAGIYLTQFASKTLIRIMHPVIDVLAGLPSVVYGVWGMLVIVPFVSNQMAPLFNTTSSGYSIMAGAIVLAVMCIPYMLNMIIEVMNTVPVGMKEASLSLGATKWEAVKHIVLKRSFPGIISAFGLGTAKAFGETIAVMMVVGNMLNTSANPFQSAYPLPALIANNYGEMLSIPLYDSALMFAAFLLFIIILIINLIFRYFIHRFRLR
jgi:phosphate transport system permease protein